MDIDKLLTLKKDLEGEWAKARTNMRAMLALYDLTFKVNVEEGFTEARPPTAPRILNTTVDHILVGNEIVIVPPVKETQKGQGQADKLEKYYSALSLTLDRQAPEPLLRSLTRNAALFGVAISKGPFWSMDAPPRPERRTGMRKTEYEAELEEWEGQRRYRCPIVFRQVDPRQVLFPVDSFPPPFFIEVGKRTARSIWETFKVEISRKKPEEFVEWVEYWDKDERFFLADGVPVLPESGQQNIGGYIPYLPVFSGLGRVPPLADWGTGTVGGGLAPEVLCKSILWDVRHSIPKQAELQSAIDAIIQLHAYPRYVLLRDGITQIYWEPGAGGSVTVPGPEYKPTLLEMPRTLPDVYQRLAMIEKEIERATFSGVIEGQAPQGVEAGYPMAILVGQARVKFGTLIYNLERAKEKMLANTSRLLEALDETLTVFAKVPKGNITERISAKDIQGHYEVNVTLSGVTPEEADRRGMLGLNFLKAGAISKRTFLERYSLIADVTGELKQQMVEMMLQNPQIQQALAQDALEAWGGTELQQTLKEQGQQGMEGGPPGRGGGPEMLGGGAGMPGLTPTPPGVPTRPAQAGGPEAMGQWIRRLQRSGGTGQGVPIGGPREEVR